MTSASANRPAAAAPPPARDGIGPSCVVLPSAWPGSVLEFLVARFPRIDPAEWWARLASGDVVDEQGQAARPDERCRRQRKLYYFRAVAHEPVLPLEETLLYRDEQIAVFDKPHGLPVVPAGRHLRETLLTRARRRLGTDSATPVHRIDRDTAGLVLFSLQPNTRDAYHALFRDRRVEKRYHAIARFDPMFKLPLFYRSRIAESSASFMQMCEVPGEANALTQIEILDVRGALALYELRPETGLRHQLRVQLAALGLPIVNDRIYPVLLPDAAGDSAALARQQGEPLQLLAQALAFVDPLTGAKRRFESERSLRFAGFELSASPHSAC